MILIKFVFSFLFSIFFSFIILADTLVPHTLREVGVTESIGSKLNYDAYRFIDSNDQFFSLGMLFDKNQAVLFFFGYYNCPMLCHFVAQGVTDLINQSDLIFGKDFVVVMLSINPDESQFSAAAFRDKYLSQLSPKYADNQAHNWHFLRASSSDIQAITKGAGFYYRYESNRKDFAHSAAIMVLSPSAIYSRYLYGINYDVKDFKLSVIEARREKQVSTLDRLLLFCYNYDPQSKKYVLMAKRVMKIGGVFIIVIILLMMFLFNRARINRDKKT
eukprot:COSAG06_NODE_6226_length_3033_cov_1.039877_3_plen_274_part_00